MESPTFTKKTRVGNVVQHFGGLFGFDTRDKIQENKLTWVIRSVDIQKILVTPNNFAILFAVLIY